MSSQQSYQTFDRQGAKEAPGARTNEHDEPPATSGSHDQEHNEREGDGDQDSEESPLPLRQMVILAIVALAEQTALNSISPYLPHMASSFPEVTESRYVGFYVGVIASAFAIAQFATNFLWGWLSDRIGRKPVILVGTVLTAVCFVLFGLCKRLWQAIAVQAAMGIVNGNQGIIATCLGEITDRSNQSRAFTYLPVLYGIGAITGPILGGVLVPADTDSKAYPYFLPNLVSAVLLLCDLVLVLIFLEESRENAISLPALGHEVRCLFARLWEFTTAARPHYLHTDTEREREPLRGRWTDAMAGEDSDSHGSGGHSNHTPLFCGENGEGGELCRHGVTKKDIILLFLTYTLFQLANVSFNSLFPIFSQTPPPIGRDMTPREIGFSLGFAGVATIVFQIFIFYSIQGKLGNKATYRTSLFLLVVSFMLMPFVGYKAESASKKVSKKDALLAVEICSILLLKTIATVGGLTSSLLLITNSAPTHSVLGALNGLAQTLSAAGRSVGPFMSGAVFSAATKIKSGEVLAFGVFAAITAVGFVLSFGIRSEQFEGKRPGERWRQDGQDGQDDGEGGEA